VPLPPLPCSRRRRGSPGAGGNEPLWHRREGIEVDADGFAAASRLALPGEGNPPSVSRSAGLGR